MNVREKELEYLIMQRNYLYKDISDFVKTFHNILLASPAALTAVLLFLFKEENGAYTLINNFPPAIYFIIIQAGFFWVIFLIAVLFDTNHNRDYIRAIDTYIAEQYGINVLFFHGELSYKHINKKSKFVVFTTFAGLAAGLTATAVIIQNSDYIFKLCVKYPAYSYLNSK